MNLRVPAQRKDQHNFRGDASGLQGNVGKRKEKKEREKEKEYKRIGQLVVGEMRVGWNNIVTCASLLF